MACGIARDRQSMSFGIDEVSRRKCQVYLMVVYDLAAGSAVGGVVGGRGSLPYTLCIP